MKNKTFLLIDDDPHCLRCVSKMLETMGGSVYTANNGVDGLELLRSRNFDLLLLDVMMPGIDGWGVFQSIRDILLNQDMPVLFFTGIENQPGLEHFNMDPISKSRVVFKGTPPQELITSIDEMLATTA